MLATKFESNHASGLSLRAETEPSNARWRCCMPTTSTVLAVGTTGNVGSMLIPMLCAAGVQVRALVRDETKAQPLRDQGVEMVFGDLDRPETLDAAVDGAAGHGSVWCPWFALRRGARSDQSAGRRSRLCVQLPTRPRRN